VTPDTSGPAGTAFRVDVTIGGTVAASVYTNVSPIASDYSIVGV
jgi:hypothetical protein